MAQERYRLCQIAFPIYERKEEHMDPHGHPILFSNHPVEARRLPMDLPSLFRYGDVFDTHRGCT